MFGLLLVKGESNRLKKNMLKRSFDIFFSFIGIIFLSPFIIFTVLIASVDTGSTGMFTQKRVGQYGKLFSIYKIRTIHKTKNSTSKFGSFLRKRKIDEFPQLINIFIGNMTFVGPRPDIKGYYDALTGEQKKLLKLKPGLTSEASIKYSNEEEILANVSNKKKFNDEIIFPDKVKMNLDYLERQTFLLDLQIIFKTIFKNE